MKTIEQQAGLFQRAVLVLIGLATVGWMAGIGLGAAVASSSDASFVNNTPAWLNPALQGVVALALDGGVACQDGECGDGGEDQEAEVRSHCCPLSAGSGP